jgi:hypothetical protein
MKLLIEGFRNFISEVQKLVCPPATQDLELNTKNRDVAIQAEHIQYGPLNVDVPGSYWQDIAKYWNTTEDAAKASLCGNCVAFDVSPRMKECMPGETSDKDGELGYCWMHHFKCHSARSCRTWAKGGPIIEDDKSAEWQEKNKESVDEAEGNEICAAGKAWAKRTYDKWPSAYASMGASKKCDQLGHKKDESLQEEGDLKKWRDENWVQSDGTPCGDDKAQKNPKRCKPKSKWSTMSKDEKSADNAKKKAGGKKGKQFVSATKKGKVTKSHTKESLDMKMSKKQLNQIIQEEIKTFLNEEEFYEIDSLDINEEYCPVCQEAQMEEEKKKPCKPSKGKRFAKRVDGKCRSFGQAGQAKSGGDRIRPGTKKGDAYCARSAGIKKCKNPPCANTLSRKKWKCRGKKSMKE